MDNLISRQAAIDAIENAFDRETILNRFVRKIAISAVRMLPSAQPEQKWIPVTERFPEEIGIYPVWTARGFGNHLSTSYWDGKEWSLRVVAWMPLPKPWKGEKDANTDTD